MVSSNWFDLKSDLRADLVWDRVWDLTLMAYLQRIQVCDTDKYLQRIQVCETDKWLPSLQMMLEIAEKVKISFESDGLATFCLYWFLIVCVLFRVFTHLNKYQTVPFPWWDGWLGLPINLGISSSISANPPNHPGSNDPETGQDRSTVGHSHQVMIKYPSNSIQIYKKFEGSFYKAPKVRLPKIFTGLFGIFSKRRTLPPFQEPLFKFVFVFESF